MSRISRARRFRVTAGLPRAVGLLAALLFYGCPTSSPDPPSSTDEEKASAPAPERAMPGSDRDEHGCIGSAGYRWCERTKQCERPWELAQKEGFENTADAFTSWCSDSGEREALD